jgi:hypothetical protein
MTSYARGSFPQSGGRSVASVFGGSPMNSQSQSMQQLKGMLGGGPRPMKPMTQPPVQNPMKPPMQNPMQGGFGSFNPMQPMQPMQPSNLGGAMADFTAQMNMGTQAPGFGAPQTMQGGLASLLGGFGPMPFPMQGGIDPRANIPSGSFNPATGVYTPGTQPMPSMPFPAQPMTQPAPPPQQPMTYPTAPQQPMTQPAPPPQTQIPSPMPGAPNMQQVRSEAPRMQAARNMQRMRGYNR